ncbi:MAG: restriction endonuclease subunit S [Prevotellaceae bacterium]|nr:restriction endonuclease subunit S [Candidatus Minthosoma caballi]
MREGWVNRRFDEVFDLQMGKTPDRKNYDYFGGDNVWVSIRDLGAKEIEDSNEHITDIAVEETKINKVSAGTVIMSFKLTVGKCGIAMKDLYTNEAIMAFNIKEGYDIISSFLYYYLQGYQWEGANKAVMGMTLNKATISKHTISIPPLSTQHSIVSELDEINNLLTLKRKELETYDKLAQSLFYEMFGDPVENEKGWEVKKLGDLCVSKLKYGSGASAIEYNGSIRYVRITDINEDGTLNDDIKSPSLIDEDYILSDGDIVFARSGATVGKTYLHRGGDIKCLYAGYLIKASVNNAIVLPEYVFRYTQSKQYKDWVDLNARAVAQPNINAKQYGDLLIIAPPLPLQQLFAQRIESIEQQKAQVKAAIEKLETLLAARMQYWFE